MSYDDIVKILKEYNQTKIQIEILKEDIKTLQKTGYSPINYNYLITKEVEEIEKNKKYKLMVEQTIFLLERKLVIIDKAIETLDFLQQQIIKKRLIENESYYKICDDLHISERYARKLKKKAVLKILDVLLQMEF